MLGFSLGDAPFMGRHRARFYSVAFSQDRRLQASASSDKAVRLRNTTTGTLLQTFKGHLCWVQSVAFSPDGLPLASGSRDNTVKLHGSFTTHLDSWRGHYWFEFFEIQSISPHQFGSLSTPSLRMIIIPRTCQDHRWGGCFKRGSLVYPSA